MFAEVISSQLRDLQEKQSQDNCMLNQVLHSISLLHISLNHMFVGLGEVQANVRGGAVSSHPISVHSQEVVVTVPKFEYLEKVIEVPRVQFEKPVDTVDAQWEALEHRRMELEDVRSGIWRSHLGDVERIQVEGEWCPANGALCVGDVVCTTESFLSSDEDLQISILSDSRGVVKEIDDDGDAQISFPKLKGVTSKTRWVLQNKFKHLLVQQNLATNMESRSLILTDVQVTEADLEDVSPTV